MEDPDFGFITFFQPEKNKSHGIWQMEEEWEMPEDSAIILCTEIPGDEHGPFKASRDFLLSQSKNLDKIWKICQQALLAHSTRWYSGDECTNLKEIYWMSTFAVSCSDCVVFEVGFESKEDHPLGQIYIEIVDGKINE